jgi:hypothetical protein
MTFPRGITSRIYPPTGNYNPPITFLREITPTTSQMLKTMPMLPTPMPKILYSLIPSLPFRTPSDSFFLFIPPLAIPTTSDKDLKIFIRSLTLFYFL